MTASRATRDAAFAAGLRDAWLGAQALSRFVSVLFEHWPPPASEVGCQIVHSTASPCLPHVELVSTFGSGWLNAHPEMRTRREKISAFHAITAVHLDRVLQDGNTSGQAALLRAFSVTPKTPMTRAQWQGWAAQHTDPALAAWFKAQQMQGALPPSAAAPRPRI